MGSAGELQIPPERWLFSPVPRNMNVACCHTARGGVFVLVSNRAGYSPVDKCPGNFIPPGFRLPARVLECNSLFIVAGGSLGELRTRASTPPERWLFSPVPRNMNVALRVAAPLAGEFSPLWRIEQDTPPRTSAPGIAFPSPDPVIPDHRAEIRLTNSRYAPGTPAGNCRNHARPV